ncbi:MAG: transposase [Betaproteobacteria bacterium]|nr:transposase [Betaproteobacteria bacterium]
MPGVRCGAHQRRELERLCRYITRPAIANERLTRDGAGDVVLQLKSAWRDGTTHIKMSPLEFMQCLAALVPRPPHTACEPADEHAHGTPARPLSLFQAARYSRQERFCNGADAPAQPALA